VRSFTVKGSPDDEVRLGDRFRIGTEVRYEPMPLQPAVNGNVLMCCSVPEIDVVLDL
jgi:hypothetical protein